VYEPQSGSGPSDIVDALPEIVRTVSELNMSPAAALVWPIAMMQQVTKLSANTVGELEVTNVGSILHHFWPIYITILMKVEISLIPRLPPHDDNECIQLLTVCRRCVGGEPGNEAMLRYCDANDINHQY